MFSFCVVFSSSLCWCQGGFGVKYLSHHFYLKATQCAKGTAAAESSKCAFRNGKVSWLLLSHRLIQMCTLCRLCKLTSINGAYVFHSPASDRLHDLLQDVSRCDSGKSKTVHPLHPQTSTHKGQYNKTCQIYLVVFGTFGRILSFPSIKLKALQCFALHLHFLIYFNTIQWV